MRRLRFLFALLLGYMATLVGSVIGNGSVIGGRVALAVFPGFLAAARKKFAVPIIFVMGSNGKTTTAKYLVHIAESAGENVINNAAGSNLPTGIAAVLIRNWRPLRKDIFSLAVFEVDEAYAAGIAAALEPEFSVVLNIQVDQIYRLFEPERVRDMFANTLPFVKRQIVVNANDALLVETVSGGELQARVSFFGLKDSGVSRLGLFKATPSNNKQNGSFVTEAATGYKLSRDGESVNLRLPSDGIHYALNGAAAIEMAAHALDSSLGIDALAESLAGASPAFGRGETFVSGKATFEIVLFKNRPSLQLNLDSQRNSADTIVLAFDEYSQDPSWLFAVDYSSLDFVHAVSGEKSDFLELALAYSDISIGKNDPDIKRVVSDLIAEYSDRESLHRLFLDYDQMMAVRSLFGLQMGVTK